MKNSRRDFLKNVGVGSLATLLPVTALTQSTDTPASNKKESTDRKFNAPYTGDNLNRIAFPLGGIGAGMFCLEGSGAFSHMSVRHKPDVFNEPGMFAAICVKGIENGAK